MDENQLLSTLEANIGALYEVIHGTMFLFLCFFVLAP